MTLPSKRARSMLMSDGTVVNVEREPQRQRRDECSRAKLILLEYCSAIRIVVFG